MKNSVPDWIRKPKLPITITVIGAGATGSLFLTHLARICHSAFAVLDKRIMVTVVDGDKVTTNNIGRQSFYHSDLGRFKAEIAVARINRTYGTNWLAINEHFTFSKIPVTKEEKTEVYGKFASNIIVTCTDTVKSRRQVHHYIRALLKQKVGPEWMPLFWLDMGNTKTTGNIIVGSPALEWPDIIEEYGHEMKESKAKESCSLAMSLNEQDLFINPFCAAIGAKWMWECLSQDRINWRGAFVNLDTLTMQKIKL